jgi:hypothetical protein
MASKHLPNFMLLVSSSDSPREEWILNLDQVRMIDRISDRGIRLIFSEQHVVNLTGMAVKDVLSLVADNCIVSDGTPLPEFMERIRSQSPTSAQPPNQPPES